MRIYLEDCPYNEKDDAKRAGARWDAGERKWFVPPNKMGQVELFNKWKPKGRMYLNCPYQDKERVKQKGAKWDSECKKWYFIPSYNRTEEQFQEWLVYGLPEQRIDEGKQSAKRSKKENDSESNNKKRKTGIKSEEKHAVKKSEKKEKVPDSQNKKRETPSQSADEESKKVSTPLAILPRINEDMTIPELQLECRTRNPYITGISNKKKQWFLDHLGIGSVWVAASNEKYPNSRFQNSTKKVKHTHKELGCSTSEKPNKKARKQDCIKTTSSSAKPKQQTIKKEKISGPSSSVILMPNTLPVSSSKVSDSSKIRKMSKPTPSSTKPTQQNIKNEKLTMASSSSVKSSKSKKEIRKTLPVSSSKASTSDKAKKKLKPTIRDSSTKTSTTLERAVAATSSAHIKKEVTVIPSSPQQSVPTVTKSMTIPMLKQECKMREPELKCSSKNKSWLLDYLGIGTEVEGSAEWMSKKKQEIRELHIHKSNCHCHPLANSYQLPHSLSFPYGTRSDVKRTKTAICDIEHKFICKKVAFRTCLDCNFDICEACYKVECLPNQEKKAYLAEKYEQIRIEQERYEESVRLAEEARRKEYEKECIRRRQEEKERKQALKRKYKRYLAKFPDVVKHPKPENLDRENRLKYTVWTSCGFDNDHWHYYSGPPEKKFNSSYDSLDEANQRVKYIFYFKNEWGFEKEDMHAESNFFNQDGMRFMQCNPPGSEVWTVSVVPSTASDLLNLSHNFDKSDWIMNPNPNKNRFYHYDDCDEDDSKLSKRELEEFHSSIINPSPRNTDSRNRLKFTVWKSHVYSKERYHGICNRDFDSSYDTLEEANQRVKYVFFHKNEYGDEGDIPYVEIDGIHKRLGIRFMTTSMDDYGTEWSVSAVHSEAFKYIQNEHIFSEGGGNIHDQSSDEEDDNEEDDDISSVSSEEDCDSNDFNEIVF